jgi:hypothetical protein
MVCRSSEFRTKPRIKAEFDGPCPGILDICLSSKDVVREVIFGRAARSPKIGEEQELTKRRGKVKRTD